jgi:hypothetical protein
MTTTHEEPPLGVERITPRGLAVTYHVGRYPSRVEMSLQVRHGMRVLRLEGTGRVSGSDAIGSADLVSCLREAAGVGFRVEWHGSVDGVNTAQLRHLSPPLDTRGYPAWPVPEYPFLTLRRGPGFVRVFNLLSSSTQCLEFREDALVRALSQPCYAQICVTELDEEMMSAVDRLTQLGMYLSLDKMRVLLPVRCGFMT